MGTQPPKYLHQAYWDEEELNMKFAVLYSYRQKRLRQYRVLENKYGVEFIWYRKRPYLLAEIDNYNFEFLGYAGVGRNEELKRLTDWAIKQEEWRKKRKRKAIWTWGTEEADAHAEELKLFAQWRYLYGWVQWIYRHPESRQKYPEQIQYMLDKYNNHPVTLRNQEENKDGGGT